jgi:hypothetical protein
VYGSLVDASYSKEPTQEGVLLFVCYPMNFRCVLFSSIKILIAHVAGRFCGRYLTVPHTR